MMPTNVRDVSTSEFASAVVARSGQVPVVVDFWAAWCGPCRVLGPILERLAAEADGEWELVKIDVDQNQALAGEFGVQGIPTVIGFRDGVPVARFSGALPEPRVREWLRDVVPSRADRLAVAAQQSLAGGDTRSAEDGFRQALEADPAHLLAGVSLAQILIDRGEAAAVSEILAALPETDVVRKLRATAHLQEGALDPGELEAKLAAEPDDWHARLALARALAAAGEYEAALEHLQEAVESGSDLVEEARTLMLDVFSLIGDTPLVTQYRRRLANALF